MERSFKLNNKEPNFKEKYNVLYLMIRDCRIEDNWALKYAQDIAIENKQGLIIGFTFFEDIPSRQYEFLIQGLKEVERKSIKLNIPFTMIKNLSSLKNISQVITDFSPLHLKYQKNIPFSTIVVDTHNIVPVWITSNKQEYAARTIRPKINKQLKIFGTEIPQIKTHPYLFFKEKTNWNIYKPKINISKIDWCEGGYDNGMNQLYYFLENIKGYANERNDPHKNKISDLSPWLHFGNISSQRCYLLAKKSKYKNDANSFIEEIVIRKELSDNFCFYNQNYNSLLGLPNWALETLRKHEDDKRETIYTLEELIKGKTYDNAWNFAQDQLINKGKIHGYMRMYWAKKVLQWSRTIEEAYENLIYLNDTYSIDGNDPNGFVGVLWCFGLHDRAWKERPIFGKIRYMSQISKRF